MEKQKGETIHYQYNSGADDDNEIFYSIEGKDDYLSNKLSASRSKIEGYPFGTVFTVMFRLLSDIIPIVRKAETLEDYTPAKIMELVEEMIDKKMLYKCIGFGKFDPHRTLLIRFFMKFWNLANRSRYYIELDQIWNYMDYVNNVLKGQTKLSLDSFHLFCSSKNLPIMGFNRKYHLASSGDSTLYKKDTPYFRYDQETDEMIEIPWQTTVRSQLNKEEIIMRASREWEADLRGDPVAEDEPNVVSHVNSAQPNAYYVYDCELNTFQEFFSATIQAIIERHYNILRCEYCKEVFVEHRKDAKYCLFAYPKKPDMTCNSYRNQLTRLRNEQKYICRRAHAKVDANVRSKTDAIIDTTESEIGIALCKNFIKESKRRRAPIRFITADDDDEKIEMTYDYLLWLSKQYSRKYNNNMEAFINDICTIKDGSDEDKEEAQKMKVRLFETHEKRKAIFERTRAD